MPSSADLIPHPQRFHPAAVLGTLMGAPQMPPSKAANDRSGCFPAAISLSVRMQKS